MLINKQGFLKENRKGQRVVDKKTMYKLEINNSSLIVTFIAENSSLYSPFKDYNDNLYDGCCCEIFFQDKNKYNEYFELEVSPNNQRFIASISNLNGKKETVMLNDIGVISSVKPVVDLNGYQIDIKIDLKHFNISDENLSLNLFRIERDEKSDVELFALNPTLCNTFHKISKFVDMYEEFSPYNFQNILSHFAIKGRLIKVLKNTQGHINDTYIVDVINDEDQSVSTYTVQKINDKLFTDIDGLMNNILLVTKYIQREAKKKKERVDRATLNLYIGEDGKPFYNDGANNYRVFDYIKGVDVFEQAPNNDILTLSGIAFGRFVNYLADFKADKLCEVLPNFHNTRVRYGAFKKAMELNKADRKDSVEDEINFVLSREHYVDMFVDLLKNKEIPLRVTHNDTKLNNVLIDTVNRNLLTVIDLDTIMPGSLCYDFGDSIRFGASTAKEDEQDLSLVSFSLDAFRAYTRGYLQELKNTITPKELEMLPYGAIMMTFECGMRFLTDHLDGDLYFRIKRANHNLDRCRTQFKLVEDMESKLEEMKQIIKEEYER